MKRNSEKHYLYSFFGGSGLRRLLIGARYWRQRASAANKRAATTATAAAVIFLLFSIFLLVLVFAGWNIDVSFLPRISLNKTKLALTDNSAPQPDPEFRLICAQGNATRTCPRNYPNSHSPSLDPSSHRTVSVNLTCPSYFRWIHEDLRRWKDIGITKDMVERARRSAHFRLVILDGRAYVEKYRQSIQTRDMFSMWGILQLLRYYPGRLPDLELMFDCDDRPVVREKEFRAWDARPPPVFRYCSDPWSLDIVFPDWSFWGWAECNIKPWENVLADIKEGNKRTKWKDRVPYAYWRGNPNVAPTRRDLLKCNVSDQNDWDTRLYIQSWEDEKKQGYKQSNLEDQCTHRYKIYTEGWAWSVSEKYILACDSMTLYIRSRYHDFFIRGMEPLKHYWPIRENTKCTSLKFAVEWGNNHTDQAQAMGEAASRLIHEEMKMDYIYDYMFHLLNEYGKLFKYKPTKPAGAIELCAETMACPANGTWRHFMEESMVMSPSETIPCTLPPYDPHPISHLLERKTSSTRQVEMWEDEYWKHQNNKQ